MTEVSQGPGWWQASDHKWYPPEQHPNYEAPPPETATPPPPSGQRPSRQVKVALIAAIAAIVVILAAGGIAFKLLQPHSPAPQTPTAQPAAPSRPTSQPAAPSRPTAQAAPPSGPTTQPAPYAGPPVPASQFQSPSGSMMCTIGTRMPPSGTNPFVACEVMELALVPPPPVCHQSFVGMFDLEQGGAPAKPSLCTPDYSPVTPWSGYPILDYGQTRTVGAITCDSEPSTMTCTDTSTGHFFRVSRDSYQLGQ
jgi:hypothetical protein